MTLNFSSGTRGAMTLPGEPAKAFTRVLFGSAAVTVRVAVAGRIAEGAPRP